VKQSLKLFFDQCCSKRLARVISETCSTHNLVVETKHLSEFCRCSTPDEKWLPSLKKQGDWIVVTADRGKDPKKQKLPLICSSWGITHISLTPALVKAGYAAQEKALRVVFPELMHAHLLPKGTKVSLGFKMVKKHTEKIGALFIQQTPFTKWCAQKGIALPTSQELD
jgi:PIN like domain